MPNINVQKVVCDIPSDFKTKISSAAGLRGLSVGKLFTDYFEEYVSSGLDFDSETFWEAHSKKYSDSSLSQLKPLSFYIPNDFHFKLRYIAQMNLRSIRSQTFHFACFVYSKL
ncbi:MAG TPA: hypothetical protein PKW61_00160 [Tenuifilaceae bacterium]|nr:hypothetical protein [Tenuifilaceae bacterium]